MDGWMDGWMDKNNSQSEELSFDKCYYYSRFSPTEILFHDLAFHIYKITVDGVIFIVTTFVRYILFK